MVLHWNFVQPFDLRKKWFYDNLYKDKRPSNELNLLQDAQVMMVDRGMCTGICLGDLCTNCAGLLLSGNIFSSSCSKIMEADPNNLKENLPVRFLGEAGVVRMCMCVCVCYNVHEA